MESAQVLDIVENLLNAAQHPDITEISRYGRDLKPGGQSPAGVKVTYQSGAQTYLAVAEGSQKPEPHPLPDPMPHLKLRAAHTMKFLINLLEAARPAAFIAWRTVAFAGVGNKPSGMEIRCADGGSAYLRVTCASGPTGDPDADPFPGYRIPASLAS